MQIEVSFFKDQKFLLNINQELFQAIIYFGSLKSNHKKSPSFFNEGLPFSIRFIF
jgi:hypothetical protein